MNVELTTDRLKIIPLNLKQFDLMLSNFPKLENQMHLNASNETLDQHLVEVMRLAYDKAKAQPNDLLWLTNWQIIEKIENKSVGSLCFHSSPDQDGFVEIGYGINESSSGLGYATEAVGALCKWTLQHPQVKAIVAKTDRHNYASAKVLKNVGFKLVVEGDDMYWWRLDSKI